MAAAPPPLRFAVIGVDHVHVFGMSGALREAGAVMAAFHALAPGQAQGFAKLFPDAERADDVRAILEDPTIPLIVCAAVPARRAAIATTAMEHGKDVLVDKPAALDADELAALRSTQGRTGRRFAVYFSERVASRATEKALALVRAGAIGRPVAMAAFGPHQLRLVPRPDWFWRPALAGGILVDLASHPIDQFLCLVGADAEVRVASARTANHATPEHPAFEDFGELLLGSEAASGYARVDWYTPAGLGTWGDGRLFLTGTEGAIEVRKQVDPAGRAGGDHLFLVDGRETRYLDCAQEPLGFAHDLLHDVRERSERAMPARHALRVCALAIEAQALASAGRQGSGVVREPVGLR